MTRLALCQHPGARPSLEPDAGLVADWLRAGERDALLILGH
jgi:hypothetical protein